DRPRLHDRRPHADRHGRDPARRRRGRWRVSRRRRGAPHAGHPRRAGSACRRQSGESRAHAERGGARVARHAGGELRARGGGISRHGATMMSTRLDLSKPLVLGALISASALLLKMAFEVEAPFIVAGAPGLIVVWILAVVLSSGNDPPAFVEW